MITLENLKEKLEEYGPVDLYAKKDSDINIPVIKIVHFEADFPDDFFVGINGKSGSLNYEIGILTKHYDYKNCIKEELKEYDFDDDISYYVSNVGEIAFVVNNSEADDKLLENDIYKRIKLK